MESPDSSGFHSGHAEEHNLVTFLEGDCAVSKAPPEYLLSAVNSQLIIAANNW